MQQDTTNTYKAGDYVGITGLEKEYEEQMRGQRGVSHKIVNVNGIEKGAYKEGAYDTTSVPGVNLHTTIDLDLQGMRNTCLMEKEAQSLPSNLPQERY